MSLSSMTGAASITDVQRLYADHTQCEINPFKGSASRGPEGDLSSLLSRVRYGEKEIFHDLVRPFERSLYFLAYSIVRNSSDAEEVVQETLLKCLASISQLRCDENFKSWLFRSAANEARMRRRKYRRSLHLSIEEGSADTALLHALADSGESPFDLIQLAELRIALHEALLGLPECYRTVFMLRGVEQLSVGETSRALGISVVNVKVRMHRARMRLRSKLLPILSGESQRDCSAVRSNRSQKVSRTRPYGD